MEMLEKLLLLLTVASWIYWMVAWWLMRGFFRARQDPVPDFVPPVSILKPVRGLDYQAYENFASFCRQEYPQFEVLFGVDDANDPAVPVIQQIQRDFPHLSIRLLVASPLGANRKASIMHHLAAHARYDVLVVSDSDMRVTPDYLRRVVWPLADKAVGLVTCLYRGAEALTLTARLEALYVAATYMPEVITGRGFLSTGFALGTTMVLRNRDLARLGGFAAVADYLADDYQIGARVSTLGLRMHLSDYVVTNILGATTFWDQWHREVRWTRCIRVSRPLEYPGLVLTMSTPLAVALLVASHFDHIGQAAVVTSVCLRWVVAWLITGYTGDRWLRRWLWLLPVRDMLTCVVWCAAGLGRRIVWRGEEFELQPDGRMRPVPAGTSRLRGAVRRPYARLRRLLAQRGFRR